MYLYGVCAVWPFSCQLFCSVSVTLHNERSLLWQLFLHFCFYFGLIVTSLIRKTLGLVLFFLRYRTRFKITCVAALVEHWALSRTLRQVIEQKSVGALWVWTIMNAWAFKCRRIRGRLSPFCFWVLSGSSVLRINLSIVGLKALVSEKWIYRAVTL